MTYRFHVSATVLTMAKKHISVLLEYYAEANKHKLRYKHGK